MKPAGPSASFARRLAARVAVPLALAVALAAVFAAYLQPDAVMALATRVWACF